MDKKIVDNSEQIKKSRINEPIFQAILQLYETRIDLGISQKELAKLSGVRQSNISRIETGTCSPDLETISKLAYAMNKKLEIKIK